MRVICSNSWRGRNDKRQGFNGSHFILLTPAVTCLKRREATQHVAGYINTILNYSVWNPVFVTNVIKSKQETFELKMTQFLEMFY